MMYTGRSDDPKPEKYKDYKNRTIEKFSKRASELLTGINSCSLKGEDKLKLLNKISEIIKESINQPRP